MQPDNTRRQNAVTIAVVVSCLAVCWLPALVAAEEAPSWKRAPADTFKLVRFALARRVEGRRPAGEGDTFDADGNRVYAFLQLFNKGKRRSVKIVWRRGSTIYHTATLTVGRSPGWRTWAFIRARGAMRGAWTVSVEDADGKELASKTFTVV